MPSPIIARADALMHRRRQSDQEFDDIPVLTDSVDDLDDIPVLTEVETALEMALSQIEDTEPPVAPAEPVAPPETLLLDAPAPPMDDPMRREQLIQELSSRIEERIKAALPEIIQSTVKDFLADQDMIANS